MLDLLLSHVLPQDALWSTRDTSTSTSDNWSAWKWEKKTLSLLTCSCSPRCRWNPHEWAYICGNYMIWTYFQYVSYTFFSNEHFLKNEQKPATTSTFEKVQKKCPFGWYWIVSMREGLCMDLLSVSVRCFSLNQTLLQWHSTGRLFSSPWIFHGSSSGSYAKGFSEALAQLR